MELPQKRSKISSISFIDEEEEPTPLKKFHSNPNLPHPIQSKDSKRIQALHQSFNQVQSSEGEEALVLSFTYWDGSNIKYSITTQKKSTIGEFLQQAKKLIKKDYPHLEKSNFLMFVKENKIIPHEYRFIDLLLAEAKGTKGPLFSLEKQEETWVDKGFVVKILERKWYDKNKHIFPASKWSIFEPQ